jgi:hypothetical protein
MNPCMLYARTTGRYACRHLHTARLAIRQGNQPNVRSGMGANLSLGHGDAGFGVLVASSSFPWLAVRLAKPGLSNDR